jgi:deoxyribodipyrimidine photolyase
MKSSCSAFINGPVEHFCPVTFGKQIDPTGVYVRTFCPELKNYPGRYLDALHNNNHGGSACVIAGIPETCKIL